jgi:ArsR family transcriptional regulator, arsenate/arsenite/antimonite-responsive transcriptional repressor
MISSVPFGAMALLTHIEIVRYECSVYTLISVNVWHDGTMPTIQMSEQRSALPLLLTECCSPVVGRVMTAAEAESLASVLKAVAEPTRLRLVSLVAAHANAEACVCDLTEPVGLSQPTVSHHLKILVDAGVLQREQRGKWAYYRLVPETLTSISELLMPPSSA